jgi:hypothetical protein
MVDPGTFAALCLRLPVTTICFGQSFGHAARSSESKVADNFRTLGLGKNLWNLRRRAQIRSLRLP